MKADASKASDFLTVYDFMCGYVCWLTQFLFQASDAESHLQAKLAEAASANTRLEAQLRSAQEDKATSKKSLGKCSTAVPKLEFVVIDSTPCNALNKLKRYRVIGNKYVVGFDLCFANAS